MVSVNVIGTGHEGLRTRARKLDAAARALNQANGAAQAPFWLALMTDAHNLRNGGLRNAAPAIRALPKGTAVILRGYDDPQRRRRARTLAALCAARGVHCLLAGDETLAGEINAAGVHMPGWMLAAARRRPGAQLVTAACHSTEDLKKAAALGVDAAFLSPAFPTASHPSAPALGPELFKKMAAGAGLPVLALGGVDECNAMALAGENVAGFAAISAFRAQ